MAEINGYQLSRAWFDFCFDNPEKINPNHTAIFMFAIEHCNRLGWKEKFGFPSQMTMDAIGIKNHHTYIKYFNDLVEWGFLKLIQKSANQYSANVISLNIAKSKNSKALDKAFIKHASKQPSEQVPSNPQSNDSIDKQQTNNQEPQTKEPIVVAVPATPEQRANEFMGKVAKYLTSENKKMLREFYDYWTEMNEGGRKMRFEMQKVFDIGRRLKTWEKNEKQNGYGKGTKQGNKLTAEGSRDRINSYTN